MSFPTSPSMTAKEDSKYYSVTQAEDGYNQELNGITYYRERSTIAPKRTFTTGFTFINTTEKDKIENLWRAEGTWNAFTWTNPETSENILVRFSSAPSFQYEGRGGTHRWSFSLTITEV